MKSESMKINMLIASTLCLNILVAWAAQSKDQDCDAPQTAIKSVRLFDGFDVRPEATVIVRCSYIRQVLNGSHDSPISQNTVVVNGEGMTLIPGLIDAHVHVWRREQLERSLDFGVTTVYDMGSSRAMAQQMRDEEIRGQNVDRADLRSAVLWVTAPGSHGTQFGEVPTLSEPGKASEFVAARVAEGADYIKIIYDHFKMFPQEIPTLSRETMTAAVDAAREKGKLAVFHSRDLEAVTHAIEAGASGFVHVPVDEVPSEDLIGLILENDIFFTPNLSLARHEASRLLEDPDFGPMLSESEIENLGDWRAMRTDNGDEIEYAAVKKLHDAGVPILIGSDMPNGGTIAGATVHSEMELLVEAGVRPIDALRAATSIPAKAYGFADRGRIAPGTVADLVMVKGEPDKYITDSRKIVTIWKSGKVHVPVR